MSYMFDIDKIARESGLPEEIIGKIRDEVRQEFPKDEMMYELHVMRAIESEKNKAMRLKDERGSVPEMADQAPALPQ